MCNRTETEAGRACEATALMVDIEDLTRLLPPGSDE